MEWVFLIDQLIMIGISSVGAIFAYRAHKNSRWLQEVLTPLVAHIESLVDPDYPKPPDPPPVEG